MTIRGLALLLGVLALSGGSAVQQAAEGPILFRMNYEASAWPNAGWPAVSEKQYGNRWTREHVVGAGPQGQNVAQLTELPGTGIRGQHTWGWQGHVVPDLEQGGTRVFRWRHRVTADSNCKAFPSNKLLIVAQGCSMRPCRVIVQPKCSPDGRIQYNFQVDGGEYQEETGYSYRKGEWLSVQLEMKTSSAPGKDDGWLKEWINTNDYKRPTLRNVGIALNAGGDDSSYIIFGGYNNTEEIDSNATNVQQYTDFEIGTTFDLTWHRPAKAGSGSPAPAPAAVEPAPGS